MQTWTESIGPAAWSLLRWITIPLSHLFTKCALPLISYKFGGPPTQLCNWKHKWKVEVITSRVWMDVKFKVLQLPTCLGWATNQTWHEWCWANRLIFVSIWLTYSVSVLLSCKVMHYNIIVTYIIDHLEVKHLVITFFSQHRLWLS